MERLLGKKVRIMVEAVKGKFYCDGEGIFKEDDYIFYRDMLDIYHMEYVVINSDNDYVLQIANKKQ